jgi:flavin-dependent dehydrogenase
VIYDLIVIGGGPAGCSAAITAAVAGARVLLLERAKFPRHKVCGEFVSAEALGLLDSLLAASFRPLIENAPRISRARIFSDDAEVRAEITPPAASIARFDLDEAQWNSAIHKSVDARNSHAVHKIERVSASAAVTFFVVATANGRFRSKALINATGRWSFLTSTATRRRRSKEPWIGIKGHFRESTQADSVDLYFFPGGYCGVQPVTMSGEADSIVNACAMVRADVARTLEEVLQQQPWLKKRSANWKAIMEPITTSPLIFHPPEPVQDDMLQVGDSATFVDPFIGDGISLALRSGHLAARSLQPFFEGRLSLQQVCAEYASTYRRELAPVFRASSHLRRFFKFPGVIRRPVLSLLERTPAITRQLVKMTR